MRTPFVGMIETSVGPTYVRTLGQGPEVLVFHGGPGLDHSPLIGGFSSIANYRTLVFFDQLGCGRTPAGNGPVTAQTTFDHAAALLDAIAIAPIGMAAYSWGVLVAAAALARRPNISFSESLLVSPTPVDSDGYALARAAITARIPASTMQEVMALIEAGRSGSEAFALLSPFYAASPDVRLPPSPVSVPVYFSVDASLTSFDFGAAIPRFGSTTVVRGDRDHVAAETIASLVGAAQSYTELRDVGHYPFFEAPDAFAKTVRKAAERPVSGVEQ